MYNRYIPNGTTYTRIVVDDAPPPRGDGAGHRPPPHAPPYTPPYAPPHVPPPTTPAGEKKGAGLAGILKGLKLDELDTGDILLLLIMLFLFLEGDDIELVITLGLVLLLSL